MGQVLCCCGKERSLVEVSDDYLPNETLSLSLKVLLLGDSQVGKSTFFKRLMKNVFEIQHKPTIGPDFVTREIHLIRSAGEGVQNSNNTSGASSSSSSSYGSSGGASGGPSASSTSLRSLSTQRINASIQVWDTAGKQRYRDLGTVFYKGSNLVLFMYDVTNSRSLENIPAWVHKFERINSEPTQGANHPYQYSPDTAYSAGEGQDSEQSEQSEHVLEHQKKLQQREQCIGYIVGNKIDLGTNEINNKMNATKHAIVTESGVEGDHDVIAKVLKDHDWIRGHVMISCKNMDGAETVQTVEKMIEGYLASVAPKKETDAEADNVGESGLKVMRSAADTRSVGSNTSASSSGETTPLLIERYQR